MTIERHIMRHYIMVDKSDFIVMFPHNGITDVSTPRFTQWSSQYRSNIIRIYRDRLKTPQ